MPGLTAETVVSAEAVALSARSSPDTTSRDACPSAPGAVTAGATQRRVDGRKRETELLLRVGDPELEERRSLDDGFRARRVRLARQLDDEPAVAGDLHDGLRRPELVDARAHHALGAADRVGAVGDDAAGLIDLEREVHAAAQVESHV